MAFPIEIEEALPEYDCGHPVIKYCNENRAVHTLGVVPDTSKLRNFIVARGRFINQGDIEESRRVCFLGATIQERLFGSRTREIGIRRAVGALKKHVFQQLFTEALTITFLGGFIGFGLG